MEGILTALIMALIYCLIVAIVAWIIERLVAQMVPGAASWVWVIRAIAGLICLVILLRVLVPAVRL